MSITHFTKPQRWDSPYDPEMSEKDVTWLMDQPEIITINAEAYPEHTPLRGILKNDTQLLHYKVGDIIVQEGDYGNSAFLILSGKVRIFVDSYPNLLLGRNKNTQKGFLATISQIWANSKFPETRDTNSYKTQTVRDDQKIENHKYNTTNRIFIEDISEVLKKFHTIEKGKSELFGELAALGRVPRTATVFAETETTLLEIRWQGIREIRRYNEVFRRTIDQCYRENALTIHLRETELFSELDENTLSKIANETLFETYGGFDWYISFQRLRSSGQWGVEHEPVIARQNDYADGLLMIRAGFARVSIEYGSGQRTLTYLSAGDTFGYEELFATWKSGGPVNLKASLTALGYVDVLRVPGRILEEYVFPKIVSSPSIKTDTNAKTLVDDAMLEWAVEERFINATKSMLIDLNRCVRCDDCVRACASTHNGNPRFIRHGKTFDHWTVVNACMHCSDPVCMIGCPTGGIYRNEVDGAVVINDDVCIGCSNCASACPYNNIQMVKIRSESGEELFDRESNKPILKATKCDLCSTTPGGPACVRACPHDALSRVDFRREMFADRDAL